MIAGQIEIQMAADLARLSRDMNEAKGIVGDAVDRMGTAVDRLRGMFAGLLGAYVGAQVAREFIVTADAMAAMEGRLRNVIGAGREFESAQKDLYRISQSNNVSLQDASTLYARIYDPIKRMGGGTREVSTTVEALTTALRINNASTAESSSAILQFSQAMAGGVLRGEEFNSVNEAAPQFLDALASALGVGRGELRKMAEDGKLTADVVGNAMPRALAELSAKAMGLPDTVGGALSDIRNDAALLAQQLDKTSGATAGLADFINAGAAVVREITSALRNSGSAANIAGQGFDTTGVAIRVVGTIAETVLVLMAEVTYTLKAIGREAGGLAAQVVAVTRGNFAEASRIGEEMRADAVKARAEVDAYTARISTMTDRVLQSRSALNAHSLSTAENAGEMQRLIRQAGGAEAGYVTLKAATTGLTDEQKKAAAAAEALRKKHEELLGGYLKTTEGIAAKVAATSLDYQQDQKLTAAQKEFLPILDALRTGKASYTELEKNGTIAKMEAALAADANNQAMAREAAWLKETADDNLKSADARVKATETIRDQIDKQRDWNDTALLSKEAIARLEIAKLQERATSLDRIATLMDEVDWTGKTSKEYRDQAAGLRQLAELKDKGIHVQAAKDSAAEWKKTSDSIEKGLTDSLFRAFESGKGFWKTLWDGIVATFQTTILKPIIQDVLSPFAQAWRQVANWISSTVLTPTISAITSGLGLGTFTGGAGAAAGAANGASSLGSLGSLASLVGNLGSGVSAGFSALLGEAGLGGALSAGATAIGAGNVAGGLGTLIGAAGPYALAAAAAVALLSSVFGSRGGPKVSGLANTGNFADIPAGGAADAEARQILATVQQLYSGTATALGGQVGEFTGAAFLARDPQGTALTQLVLDAAVNGREVFSRNNRTSGGNVEDVGRDETSFKNAVAEAQTRALLASLQATTFSDDEVARLIRSINARDSAQRISEQIQEALNYKAQKDAAAAAAAGTPTTSGNSATPPGLGAFVGVSVQQYDAGNQAIVDELKALRADVNALKADNTAENTASTTLLHTIERILVRVSGGEGNPGDALSVRSLSTP